ncbi:MAG: ATP-binding protein [Solirubrobacterales bacterium]|nr:ATP-binding protein [Solirubrobacterales bacterium]
MRRLDGIDSVRDDALLVTSELVSSAVLRAGCDPREEIEVVADLLPDGVRIAVAQPRPRPQLGEPFFLAGLGLRLVEALAQAWGVEGHGQPRLWAELAV